MVYFYRMSREKGEPFRQVSAYGLPDEYVAGGIV